MVWFKVDDDLYFHQKVLAAGNSAMGMWVRAGSWASSHLTDGFIPGHVALSLGSSSEVDHLVAAGLWIPVEGGFRFHEWEHRNFPAEVVLEKRRRHAEAQAKSAEQARNKRLTALSADQSVTNPDQSVTLPQSQSHTQEESSNELSSRASRRKPELPLPPDWMPTAEHRELARKKNLNLDAQAERFRDHALAHDRRLRNWNMGFTTWLKSPFAKPDPFSKRPEPSRDALQPFVYPDGVL